MTASGGGRVLYYQGFLEGKRSNHVIVSGKGEVPDPGLDQGDKRRGKVWSREGQDENVFE